MTALQEQAIQMVSNLSDDNAEFIIEIIQRLMPQTYTHVLHRDKRMQAFRELDAARHEIKNYLPDDFDPDQELEAARAERYGDIG